MTQAIMCHYPAISNRRLAWISWALAGALMSMQAIAQQTQYPGPTTQRFSPGLAATFSVDGKSYTRNHEAILFSGSVDEQNVWRPDSRLPTGPFRVRWSTRLNISEAGKYQFHFYGQGRFQLWIDGAEALSLDCNQATWFPSQAIDLAYGFVDLEAEYESNGHAVVGLFWSSNHFQLEPIKAENYSCSASSAATDHAMGRALSRALRCQACHQFACSESHLAAPALTHLIGNLEPAWLVDHLTATADVETQTQTATRKMPYYGLNDDEAESIAAALFEASVQSAPPENWSDSLAQQQLKRNRKDPPLRTIADPAQGQQHFVSLGCIACHQLGELGQLPEGSSKASELFSGGNLSGLADKRPSAAIARWLSDPQTINVDHRMPSFELTALQKLDLHAWLSQAKTDSDSTRPGSSESQGDTQLHPSQAALQVRLENGRNLIAKHQCGACHRLPQPLQSAVVKTRITEQSRWTEGCLSRSSHQANQAKMTFKLSEPELQSLHSYLQTSDADCGSEHPEQLLAENNCLSCHRRGTEAGLSKQFIALSENYPELSTRLAAITPPALDGIGDKLHRDSLTRAVGPNPERLREWLDIRMPKFRLKPEQLGLLSDYFISHDRIPDNSTWRSTVASETRQDQAYWLAAARLVTPDGFSCQSCHQIADSKPSGIALNAHGTNLTTLGSRIREPWFYRWLNNPSRIVPRIEMPAIQTPVHGLLDNSLKAQLQALWMTLNQPDFRPPKPNPVRVIRNYNDGSDEHAHVLTDVIEVPAVVIRPLIVGLPNRHNLMIDHAKGGLQNWWLGDVARQHTRGKSWHWELGAQSLVKADRPLESWTIEDSSGDILEPTAPSGRQFAMELDQVQHVAQGVRWRARLHFSDSSGTRRQTLRIEQHIIAVDDFRCKLLTQVHGLTAGQHLRLESPGIFSARKISAQDSDDSNSDGRISNGLAILEGGHRLEYLSTAQAHPPSQHQLVLQAQSDQSAVHWECRLTSSIAADKFVRPKSERQQVTAKVLECVPGFSATELPLPISEMPISFAWDESGQGYVGSLKGRVLQLMDTNEDGWEDDYRPISDEIPTPYGLYAGDEGIDVVAKYGLLRLTPASDGGPLRDWQVVADGWGYTQDYHDWAVGLERDKQGNYFITLPCQQDDRSPEAAYLRGHALRLVKQASPLNDRLYSVESIAAGLRFPMGIALSSSGELFTSDNQGNYTPFNELNHLRSGKRYGFINKLENKDGFAPPFESPAINIPHPWMRSVNGICFLETPSGLSTRQLFGPFEGHLLGCEMNGRCLVRMSLQWIDGQYQGAVYPFSLPLSSSRENFEGPIVCEVAPSGDIYIGNLRDSGWGGGNNTGSIVRLKPDGTWPLGIAEVRATKIGLEVYFTQSIDINLANQKQNYTVRSYTRTPTPAYGGDDQEEQFETIDSIEVDDSGLRVLLKLDKLRAGVVYEINLSAIGPDASALFPSQAHYTMRAIPL